jgi:hypothetical protein
MRVFKSSLRGEAVQWFEESLGPAYSKAEALRIKTNWTLHCRPALQEWYEIDDVSRGVNWNKIQRQRSEEGAMEYCTRAYAEVAKFAEAEMEVRCITDPPRMGAAIAALVTAQVVAPAAVADGAVAPAVAPPAVPDQVAIDLCTRNIEEFSLAERSHGGAAIVSGIVRLLLASGFSDPKLRTEMENYNSKGAAASWSGFMKEVRRFQFRLIKPDHGNGSLSGSNSGNGNKNKKKHVNTVDGDLEENPDDSGPENVDQVTRKKKSPASTSNNKEKKAKCKFCRMTGHVIEQCRKREAERAIMRKEDAAKKAHSTSQVSDAPSVHGYSESGNGNGQW